MLSQVDIIFSVRNNGEVGNLVLHVFASVGTRTDLELLYIIQVKEHNGD